MKQQYKLIYVLISISTLLFTTQSRANEVLEAHCMMAFPEAMMELQEAIKSSGYKIVRIQKIDKGLQGKGYKSEKYRLIFFGRADEITSLKQKFPEVIPLLPLKMALYAEKQKSVVVVANPKMYTKLYDNKELKIIFMRWQEDINRIIKTFKNRCQET